MIKVRCITNLDDYDCSGITEMVCRPMIGDWVTVKYKGEERWLKICSLRHGMFEARKYEGKQPILIVELTK